MQEEALLALLRLADRAQTLDCSTVAERDVCRILEEEISAGAAQRGTDEAAVPGLDGVRRGLGAFEEVVGGLDVVLRRQQLGDDLSGLLGERPGIGDEALGPGTMPEPGPL